MRSGRGKCPQCKEMIVVDLDAQELRCPFCNALLKKSAKSVAEARAEQAAKEKEAQAAAAAAAAAVETPAPAEVATPAPEAVVETPAPVEEVPAEVAAPAEEAPEQVDEIGISDEELAAMDASVPEETPAASEAASEPAEAVDEIGISDEELAMMDADVPEEVPATTASAEDSLFSDQPTTEAAPATETADEPLVFGSIGAVDGDQTPEEEDSARVAAEDTVSLPEEDEAPVNNNVTLEDDVDPALLDDDIPMIENAEPEAPAEEPTAEPAPLDDLPAEADVDVAAEVAAPIAEPIVEAEPSLEVEDAPAIEVEDAAPVAEVSVEEAAPAEEPVAPAADAPAEEPYVPTEEDMAFAASLSETTRTPARVGFVAAEPVAKKEKKEKKSRRTPKESAPKGDNTMRGSIYKKPVALIMMILSILAAAVWFLYIKPAVFTLISVDLAASITNALPTFGGEMFGAYVIAAFAGLIAVVSILGLTGKKCKLGFLFVLLADLVYALVSLCGTPLLQVEALQNIVTQYGEYAAYAIYGLIFLAAIFFAISLGTGKTEYDFSGGSAILPLIYMAVVIVGYIALILLPKFVESFSVSAEIVNYAILGAIGLALLMTFVGVHNGSTSRAVNGWFVFATLITLAVINAVPIVVAKFVSEADALLFTYVEIPELLTPIISIFAVAGFTAADMRN